MPCMLTCDKNWVFILLQEGGEMENYARIYEPQVWEYGVSKTTNTVSSFFQFEMFKFFNTQLLLSIIIMDIPAWEHHENEHM